MHESGAIRFKRVPLNTESHESVHADSETPVPFVGAGGVTDLPADELEQEAPPIGAEMETETAHGARVRSGLLLAGGAYAWWGVVIPSYMHMLRGAGAYELLAMRVLWGIPVILALLWFKGDLRALWGAFRDWATLRALLISTPLIAVNWYTFTFAVVEQRLSEASLGYYINPMVSVALGTLVLGEKLRPAQWVAIALACVSVSFLAIEHGSLPWITVTVALSFGLYGLVRKRAKANAAVGLGVEMLLLGPFLLVLQGFLYWKGTATFGTDLDEGGLGTTALLALAGLITVVPLVAFAAATRKLKLSTIGLMQYIAPTGQLIFAATVQGKDLGTAELIAFGVIWLGVAVFTVDSLRAHRAGNRARRDQCASAGGSPSDR